MANYVINIRGGSTGSINNGSMQSAATATSASYQNLSSTTLGKRHDQTRFSRGATGIDSVVSNTLVPTKAINNRGEYITLSSGEAASHTVVTLTLAADVINKTILRLSGTNSTI